MRTVTAFYLESAVSSRQFMRTTAPQVGEKLERIFTGLESYGAVFSEDRISGITPVVLQKWFNASAREWKPATCNSYICTINRFLRWAHSMEFIDKDLSGVLHTSRLPDPSDLPPEDRPKNKYYTHDQAQALLSSTVGHNRLRDRAIIALLLYGGFRVSEICALTIGQVMSNPGTVTLRRKGGAWCDAEVSPDAYPHLEAYLRTRPDRDNPEAPLFLTSHGRPCTRNQIYKALSPKQQALGLATGPHALRHTAISEVNNTCGALAARDFANHRSMTVTDRYSHTTKEQRQAAVRNLKWGTPQ